MPKRVIDDFVEIKKRLDELFPQPKVDKAIITNTSSPSPNPQPSTPITDEVPYYDYGCCYRIILTKYNKFTDEFIEGWYAAYTPNHPMTLKAIKKSIKNIIEEKMIDTDKYYYKFAPIEKHYILNPTSNALSIGRL